VLVYVADCLAHNSTPAEVRKQLVVMGYSANDANHLVQAAQAQQGWGTSTGAYPGTDAAKAAGKRNMAIGGIVCVVGLVITLGSLTAASNSGGGYVVAWGAIVFGAIQFFRGAAQAGGGSSEAG
jgi:lactam utilization protein B